MRVMVATGDRPSVSTGSIQCFHVNRPEAGSHPSLYEKMMMAISPIQKLGIEAKNMDITVTP